MHTPLGIDDLCERIGVKPTGLALLLKVTDSAVSQWRETGMPPGRALELERKLEGTVRAVEIKTTQSSKRKAPKGRRASAA